MKFNSGDKTKTDVLDVDNQSKNSFSSYNSLTFGHNCFFINRLGYKDRVDGQLLMKLKQG